MYLKFTLILAISVAICLNIAPAKGQTYSDTTRLNLDFPLVDWPYQRYAAETRNSFIKSYANPSMRQSVAVSNSFYSAAHYGIEKLVKMKDPVVRIILANTLIAGFDYFSSFIPFGLGWLHEEYHRAVMTKRGINSFNDINTFPIGSSSVAVSRIKDEELVRLYNEHRTDFIRLQTAGIEAQYYQTQILQKNNFYYNQRLQHIPLYWLHTINSADYVTNSGDPEAFDKLVDDFIEKEGADISKRDFTGPDFTAWVNALFHPERRYQDRGVHPSGVGINRYIKPSQLSTEERDYLKKQGGLQWLNLLSPHLFGFPKIKIKSNKKGNYYGNFAVRHLLTTFGNDISLDIFYQTPKTNYFFAVHNYNNKNASFLGLEGAIIDKPLLEDKLLLSGRAMVWTQPDNQSFTEKKGSLGGLVNLRGALNLGMWSPYVEIEGKTKGWVMGNVFIEDNVSVIAGLNLRIKG
jgi:hypothetical protein